MTKKIKEFFIGLGFGFGSACVSLITAFCIVIFYITVAYRKLFFKDSILREIKLTAELMETGIKEKGSTPVPVKAFQRELSKEPAILSKEQIL